MTTEEFVGTVLLYERDKIRGEVIGKTRWICTCGAKETEGETGVFQIIPDEKSYAKSNEVFYSWT